MDVDLKAVQRTLLMPLWGRAKLTRLGNPILSDPKAVEIVDQLGGVDFSEIDQAFSDLFNAAWIIRAKMFDEAVGEFLAKSRPFIALPDGELPGIQDILVGYGLAVLSLNVPGSC